MQGSPDGSSDLGKPAEDRARLNVSWCRLDLVLLYGEPIADTFLAAYQAAAGITLADPVLWDLHALANSHSPDGVETWMPNYRDLGRTDRTAAELPRRHTTWTESRLTAAAG